MSKAGLIAYAALLGLLACGGGAGAPAKTGGTGATTAAKKAPAKAEATPDPKAEAAAKAHKIMKELTKVTLKDNEIDLNTGVIVLFATGSDDIDPNSYDILDEIASVMADHPTIKIRVEGHTDSTGNIDSNYDLSARRADAVVDYLAAWGIPADHLDSAGCGPDVPIADNATADGQATNRRVEFIVVKDGMGVCVPM